MRGRAATPWSLRAAGHRPAGRGWAPVRLLCLTFGAHPARVAAPAAGVGPGLRRMRALRGPPHCRDGGLDEFPSYTGYNSPSPWSAAAVAALGLAGGRWQGC